MRIIFDITMPTNEKEVKSRADQVMLAQLVLNYRKSTQRVNINVLGFIYLNAKKKKNC